MKSGDDVGVEVGVGGTPEEVAVGVADGVTVAVCVGVGVAVGVGVGVFLPFLTFGVLPVPEV